MCDSASALRFRLFLHRRLFLIQSRKKADSLLLLMRQDAYACDRAAAAAAVVAVRSWSLGSHGFGGSRHIVEAAEAI